jgi:hypothetical protein
MVDLGALTAINRVILKCDSNYAKAFQIQVSANSTSWTDVYSTTIGAAYSVTDVSFPTATARYIRMYGTQRGTQNGYSLFDFMVLNDSVVTPAAFKAEKSPASPGIFLIGQNASVSYKVAHAGMVKLEAFDAAGKLVAVLVDGFQNPGYHHTAIPGRLGKGLFLFRLIEGGHPAAALRTRVSIF